MSDMNGAVKMPGMQIGNPMVQALEAILAKVKAGEVSTIAIIAMSTTGYYPPFMMGPQRSDLSVALDMAKATLLAEIFSPPKAGGGLVRAPAGLNVKG